MSNHESNPPNAPEIDGQSPQLAGQFARLLAEHQRTIFLYLSTIQNGGQEVDDLFQETCVKCWEEFHSFQPGTNFGAWACTIAFNRARAWRKTRSRSKVVFSDKCLEMISVELIEHEQVLQARTVALRDCIEGLQDHHRKLLRWRYYSQEPIESLAKRLDRSADAVYRMLSRIRQSLHDCIQKRIGLKETS